MKEKTAMQILIKEIDNKLSGGLTDTLRYSLEECKNMANSLLKKEQEQIEKAFEDGVTDVFDSAFNKEDIIGSGEQYYQSKYGGENVDR